MCFLSVCAMVGCTVLGCKSRSERNIPGITFHTFPSNPDTRSQWVDATGRPNWYPTKHSKICSVHFGAGSFNFKNKLVRLESNSVPIKEIHVSSSDLNITLLEQPVLRLALPSTSKNEEQLKKLLHKEQQKEVLYKQQQQKLLHKEQQKELLHKEQQKELLHKEQQKELLHKEQQKQLLHKEQQKELLHKEQQMEQLKRLLHKEKTKSANRLKKLRAVRASNRRLSKKLGRLENIIAELNHTVKTKSQELDLLSKIELQVCILNPNTTTNSVTSLTLPP